MVCGVNSYARVQQIPENLSPSTVLRLWLAGGVTKDEPNVAALKTAFVIVRHQRSVAATVATTTTS